MGKYEKLIQYVEGLNLQILDYDYKNNKAKLKDEEGYLYYLSVDNIKCTLYRNGDFAKFFNGNPYTKENIVNYITLNNIKISIIDDFSLIKSAKDKIRFSCDIHGAFQKCWNEIKNSQYCPDCGKEHAHILRRNKINDIKLAFEKENYILLTDTYINNLQELVYICPKHGIQKTTWANFVTGSRCFACTRESIILSQTKSHNEFVEELSLIYENKFIVVDKYKNAKSKIRFYCNDCKTEFEQSPQHILAGHCACNCKVNSFGEVLIDRYLNQLNIKYKRQYRFKDCKNVKPLPFDFVIFDEKDDIKLLIEFQGKQHYMNTGWSSDVDKSLECFNKQNLNDNIKRQYCLTHNINLLEIPYWQISNINSILDLVLNIKEAI